MPTALSSPKTPPASLSSAINPATKSPLKALWGVGLRPGHFASWRERAKADEPVQFEPLRLEILTDQMLFHRGGPGLANTDALAKCYPMLLHGVGMNLGAIMPLDPAYLRGVRELIRRFEPAIVSDHLAFSASPSHASQELLPVPRTQNALTRLCERVDAVQTILQREIALENPSAYIAYKNPEMSEGEFFTALCARTGCGLLLDVNNLYVNAHNFTRDSARELHAYPLHAVRQIHVAGHMDFGDYLFDTHDQPVLPAVIALLSEALQFVARPVPVILEWDDDAASLSQVLGELARVRARFEHIAADDYRRIGAAVSSSLTITPPA
jgi:uncharacterized protein (UPF0276 family)